MTKPAEWWVPFDASGWPDLVEVLEASGRPWPRAAAIFDLRWQVDRTGKTMGRRRLCKRWGWTDRQARALLADELAWWDPIKGASPGSTTGVPVASRSRPGAVPVASRSRPDDAPKEKEEPSPASRSRPGAVPVASRSRPADVHTRADLHPHQTPTSDRSPPSPPDGGDVIPLDQSIVESWEREHVLDLLTPMQRERFDRRAWSSLQRKLRRAGITPWDMDYGLAVAAVHELQRRQVAAAARPPAEELECVLRGWGDLAHLVSDDELRTMLAEEHPHLAEELERWLTRDVAL